MKKFNIKIKVECELEEYAETEEEAIANAMKGSYQIQDIERKDIVEVKELTDG